MFEITLLAGLVLAVLSVRRKKQAKCVVCYRPVRGQEVVCSDVCADILYQHSTPAGYPE